MSVPHLEASSFEFVRMRTTIPIPRIRRAIEGEDDYIFIVMDYILGERLDHVWSSPSLWSKLWVALILRRYIRQLCSSWPCCRFLSEVRWLYVWRQAMWTFS
ncbi:hypothetical protein BJV78DRAFT_1249817 [Lactifluus subvellereus]|nr:hypothetical protein BJV78DRAFT_1249817 [Lactifluus subvellereus]